ncbi:MAG TPA: YciI family protein, partial [Thermoanaerobaculia bacterium]
MKYMLMMSGSRTMYKEYFTWPVEDIKAQVAFMQRFNDELKASGELVSTHGLTSPDAARLVRAGNGGAPAVTDGPFAEAKEFRAGFWIVDCESRERAYEIAARASSAPGKGGAPANMPIEV